MSWETEGEGDMGEGRVEDGRLWGGIKKLFKEKIEAICWEKGVEAGRWETVWWEMEESVPRI